MFQRLNNNLEKNYYTLISIDEMMQKEKERIDSSFLKQTVFQNEYNKLEKELNLTKFHFDQQDKKTDGIFYFIML